MTSFRYDPLSDRQLDNPYPMYQRMRDECPIFFDETRNVWVVTRHEDVLTVALDPETYSSENAVRLSTGDEPDGVKEVLQQGWSLTPNLTESDGEQHRQLRAMVGRVFTPGKVAQLDPFIRKTIDELVDGFIDAGHTDIIERYAWPLPLITMAQILGIPQDDVPQLHQWSYDWLRLSESAHSLSDRVKYAHSVVAMQHYIMGLFQDKEATDGDDLISLLLRSAQETSMDTVQVMQLVMNLIIAGHVTVTRAIGNGIVTLLDHQLDVRESQLDEQLTKTMVDEILRFESPVQGLFRTVMTDTELGGERLRRGDRVMVHWGAANRDERVISDPERFDIERKTSRHNVAFGRGIHACLGAPLARLQLQIAIPRLFERLPGLQLASPDSWIRDRIMIARGFVSLELRWDQHEKTTDPMALTAPRQGLRAP
ncbi:cytochrome P450 [Streptomyces sp. A1-5]|uniref:cytochrome P450 n=1 Tax=Streptomyces sp. A1-5 TaxID=2738410 RepID=UPI001F22B025|nr:cytochrome P450 [Streptomyces sp. A1-5]UJB45209.1 cytochrome P450 [Streptomyces sp. A1-5]